MDAIIFNIDAPLADMGKTRHEHHKMTMVMTMA